MKSMKKWAERLAEAADAGELPSPAVFAAFARDYLSMADHADRQSIAAALHIEARAMAYRLDGRGTEALALEATAGDIRAGIHILESAPQRQVFSHVEKGDAYELVPILVETKNDITGDWDPGVAYRSLTTHQETLYVTSQQRFDDRFIEVADPHVR